MLITTDRANIEIENENIIFRVSAVDVSMAMKAIRETSCNMRVELRMSGKTSDTLSIVLWDNVEYGFFLNDDPLDTRIMLLCVIEGLERIMKA